jgi:hypothetical protein
MAIDEHSISRRVVIGALAAAPIIATASVVEAAATGGALTDRSSEMNMQATIFDISPATRWTQALAAYRGLYAEWVAHPYGKTAPGSPDYDKLEAEEGVIADRRRRGHVLFQGKVRVPFSFGRSLGRLVSPAGFEPATY